MKLNDWLNLLGNFGLVVGLGLAAWQIHQSSNIAATQLQHESMLGLRDMYLHAAGDEISAALATAIDQPDELTTQQLQSLNL